MTGTVYHSSEPCRIFYTSSGSTYCNRTIYHVNELCKLSNTSSRSTHYNGVLLLYFNIYLLDITSTNILHHSNHVSIQLIQSGSLKFYLLQSTLIVTIILRYLILVLQYGGLIKGHISIKNHHLSTGR